MLSVAPTAAALYQPPIVSYTSLLMADSAEIILGIDLGTTNSLVAVCDERGPRIIADAKGRNLLPSVVRYNPATGQVDAIGHEARSTASLHPRETIFSVKRLMGRGIDDIRADLEYLPCKVVEGPLKTARVQIGARVFSPQEVSAVILRQLRQTAEAHFGRTIRKAVVTVPAYFDDAQRQATRDAGRLAGLDVVRIVNEPTAASLAYNLGLRGGKHAPPRDGKAGAKESRSIGLAGAATDATPAAASGDSTVAVFDLGGGTFDISILRLHHADGSNEGGAVDQVLATAGDTHLGGDDVDRMLVELVQSEIRARFGAGIMFPPSTLQALRTLAEETKIRLSSQHAAVIELDMGNGRVFQRSIDRAELERLIEPWVQKTIESCKRALRAAELDVGAIERVVMVGGSTRIPLVQQRVREFFGLEPYTALNPDEVVALGAAVQASILMGINRGLLLLDVIPLSLGIETMGGAVAKLIPANTTIPARATEMFSTYVDGQANVKIHVLQGERELVKDCRSLGQFELRGIPPMPAGLPKIEVAFLVDANGILSVSAIERRSEKSASIQIVPNHGLTREEVQRIESESLAHAREDMTAHRLIDLRLHAQKDIRDIERQLAKVGEQLEPDYRGQIEARIAEVRGFLNAPAPDAEAFAKALTGMDHATIRLAEIAIKAALAAEGVAHSP